MWALRVFLHLFRTSTPALPARSRRHRGHSLRRTAGADTVRSCMQVPISRSEMTASKWLLPDVRTVLEVGTEQVSELLCREP